MDDAHYVIDATEGLGALFDRLRSAGYQVIGPTVRDSAIVYGEITSVGDLPIGWTDEQDGGHYRLKRRDDIRPSASCCVEHSPIAAAKIRL